MGFAIILMLREIIPFDCKFPDVGIEISPNYDLQLPFVHPIYLQHMRHEGNNLFVLFCLSGAEVQGHHEELIGEADGWSGLEVAEPFPAEKKVRSLLRMLGYLLVLLLHESVGVVKPVEASTAGVDKDVAICSSAQLLNDGDVSLILDLIDELI